MKDYDRLVSVPQLNQSTLYSKWKSFVEGAPLDENKVFNKTYLAWQRCVELGIDPYHVKEEILSEEELHYRQGKMEHVFQLLEPHISTFKKALSTHSSTYIIYVADQDGYIIKVVKESSDLDINAPTSTIRPGLCFAERCMGNNAIGTVIFTGQPLAVIGPEHYVMALHRWSCVGSPIFDSQGNIAAVIGLSTPAGFESPYTFSLLVAATTAVEAGLRQNRVEHQLRETIRILSQLMQQREIIFNSMSQGVVILNKDGVVTYFNRAAEKIWNISSVEIDGRTFDCLVRGKCSLQEPLLIKTIKEGRAFTNVECHCKNDHGGKRLLVNTSLLMDDNDSVAGAIGIYTDVTDLRRQEERIRQQDKLALVGQMAAGMAHEIRNPLTTVRGFAQLLSEKEVWDQNVARKHLKLMIEEIDRADSFIGYFLQLAKPKPPNQQVSCINKLITDFVQIFETQAFLQGIKVITDLGDVPNVVIDSNQIKQVLLNFCQNALHAMGHGGILALATRYIEADKMVRIDVIDNGRGISPQDLSRVGTPFFTTKDNGTGLGLTISYAIIDSHQGRVEVDSLVGVGTRFSFYLPVY